MPVTNYPIFQHDKRPKIHFEFFSLCFIIVASVVFMWMRSVSEVNIWVFWIVTLFFILSFVPLIVTLILNHYKIDFKRGKFKGNLILNENYITINHQNIPLAQIKNIQFTNADFFTRYERNKWIGPKISSGVGNICTLKLKGGKVIQVHFYQSHDNELVKAAEILKHYHSKNILNLTNLNTILYGIN